MTPPHRARAPWAALVAVSAGLFLAVLSTTMVSVALPTLGHALGAGPTGLERTVDAYVLVYAALLIPGGALLVAGFVLIGSALAIAPLLRTRSAVAPVAAR